MNSCIFVLFLAFLAFTLAEVSAYYHNVITFNIQEGENNRLPKSIKFGLPYEISSGWCASQENEHKNASHSAKIALWNCIFFTMINGSANCVTRFQTAESKPEYTINLKEERSSKFIIETTKKEVQIDIKSPSSLEPIYCRLRTDNTKDVFQYDVDSMITLDRVGEWDCISLTLGVFLQITLRNSEHDRMYKIKDGVETDVMTQDQGEINIVLTEMQCQANNKLPTIRPYLESSYISIEKSGADAWKCSFHKSENTSCTFSVQETFPSSTNINERMFDPGDTTYLTAPADSMTLVLLSSVAGAALVIIFLICVIFHYKNKVKKWESNAVPPSIISRAPFEAPPEIVYDCVYSHPAGLKRPGIKKEKNADQKTTN